MLNAQTSTKVFDLYMTFNEQFMHDKTKAIKIADQILSSPEKLPAKQETNFYYKIATIYENMNNPQKAMEFFSKVTVAEPDFYVPHRAVGFLYLKEANSFVPKINASKGNKEQYDKNIRQYKAVIKKAIPHLEKAAACDPNEETYNLIKSLYKTLNETESIKTLDARLAKMASNCVTVLTDF